MKNITLLFLLALAFAGCKKNLNKPKPITTDTSKLLLSETMSYYDSVSTKYGDTTYYSYDNHSRLIQQDETDSRFAKYSGNAVYKTDVKYVYNTSGNLVYAINTRSTSYTFPFSGTQIYTDADTIKYYYNNNIPSYIIQRYSGKHIVDLSANKIIKATTGDSIATYTYNGNNMATLKKESPHYYYTVSNETFTYGTKKNPFYGRSFKWLNWGDVSSADNEVLKHKFVGTSTDGLISEDALYNYTYNDKGYPITMTSTTTIVYPDATNNVFTQLESYKYIALKLSVK